MITTRSNAQTKWRGTSGGTAFDASLGVEELRDYAPDFNAPLRNIDTKSSQLNLIGYSYGSLVAAQEAVYLAKQGATINNLVLIGSPISAQFLKMVQSTSNIRNVTILNLTAHGDPIHAGMSGAALDNPATLMKLYHQQQTGTGHFYYAPLTAEGHQRRVDLSEALYNDGLR